MSYDPSPHLPSLVAPPGVAEVDLQPAKPTEVSLPPSIDSEPSRVPRASARARWSPMMFITPVCVCVQECVAAEECDQPEP
jgi:hypothetical protein